MARPQCRAVATMLNQDWSLSPDTIKARLMRTASKTFPNYSTATDPSTGTSTPPSTTSSASEPATWISRALKAEIVLSRLHRCISESSVQQADEYGVCRQYRHLYMGQSRNLEK